jgi:hypothetical protein
MKRRKFSSIGLGLIGALLGAGFGVSPLLAEAGIAFGESRWDRHRRRCNAYGVPDLSAERIEAAKARRERKNLDRLGCWAESFGNNLIFGAVDRIPRPCSPVVKAGSRGFRPEPLKVPL